MKIIVVSFVLFFLPLIAFSQTDSTKIEKHIEFSSRDSLFMKHMAFRDSVVCEQVNSIAQHVSYILPRYKLYQTENLYNLIKLDTATGALWQVQYDMNKDAQAMTVEIDTNSLLWYGEEVKAGRFELYPTKNIYTFILLDNENGHTWQVQWNTFSNKRFRKRIW